MLCQFPFNDPEGPKDPEHDIKPPAQALKSILLKVAQPGRLRPFLLTERCRRQDWLQNASAASEALANSSLAKKPPRYDPEPVLGDMASRQHT